MAVWRRLRTHHGASLHRRVMQGRLGGDCRILPFRPFGAGRGCAFVIHWKRARYKTGYDWRPIAMPKGTFHAAIDRQSQRERCPFVGRLAAFRRIAGFYHFAGRGILGRPCPFFLSSVAMGWGGCDIQCPPFHLIERRSPERAT